MKKPVVVHGIRGYLSHTETFVGNQITGLQAFAPVVVCHHLSENRQFDIQNMHVIKAHQHGFHKAVGFMTYEVLRALSAHEVNVAAKWAREFNPTLMHLHYAVDATFYAPLFKKLRIPTIVSLYGYDVSSFPRALGGFGTMYLQRAFKAMDCFLAMSEDMKRDAVALGAPEEKIIVHYHGINATRFKCESRSYERKQSFNILCVGTLEKKKGQHHLLHAVAELRRQRPDIDARVTLVGKGPLVDECKKITREQGLTDRVHIAGYVPHLSPDFVRYYWNADVFVHFSTIQPGNDKEGIPGTIVEAMASGLPVIATQHAGIPEAITNGTHGILLEEKNIKGITSSLIDVFENEQLRRRLGLAAAQRALNHLDVRTKTRDLEQIYETISARKDRLKNVDMKFDKPSFVTAEER